MIHKQVQLNLQPDQTLYIIPVGDVHYNTDECDKPRFHATMEWARQKVKKGDLVYGIGLGDYNDTISPSERASIVSAKGGFGLHDTTLRELDKAAKKLTDRFARAIRNVRFLGLCEGHHYMTFSGVADKALRGASTTEYLCDLIDCPYLGTLGVIDLIFQGGKQLRLVATHGYGGARTAGARVIKRVRMAEVVSPSSDTVYLMGHDDEKMVKGSQLLDFDDGGKFVSTKVAFVGTGSFQRAYHLGRSTGDYVEQLMLPPAQLGVSMIDVQMEKRGSKWHLSWHVSI